MTTMNRKMTTKYTKKLNMFDLINVDILVITDNGDTNDMVVVMQKTFLKCLLSCTVCPAPYREINHVHTTNMESVENLKEIHLQFETNTF